MTTDMVAFFNQRTQRQLRPIFDEYLHPTTSWQQMNTGIGKQDFDVATDLFYINVSKQ
jgi:hypothetical protein